MEFAGRILQSSQQDSASPNIEPFARDLTLGYLYSSLKMLLGLYATPGLNFLGEQQHMWQNHCCSFPSSGGCLLLGISMFPSYSSNYGVTGPKNHEDSRKTIGNLRELKGIWQYLLFKLYPQLFRAHFTSDHLFVFVCLFVCLFGGGCFFPCLMRKHLNS